ncbi:MAG: M6 family metalloprotease domain-containing protein [Bacteroidaceae bacterium]|nr:M6 family metalloprotease domain-containing protein [Bacteroidaceae bacterium]
MKRLFTLFVLATLTLTAAHAQADDPRHPVFHKTQPDGSPLAVRMYGGSHADFVFYTTLDSIALVLDGNTYCYARPEGGRLVSTGVAAHEAGSRTATEQTVAAQSPTLHEAVEALKPRATRRRIGQQPNRLTAVSADGLGMYGRTLGGMVNSIGEYTLPVVLVQFADRKFNASSTDEKFSRWLNSDNYVDNGATGSVKQYFTDQSKGMFVPTFEIVARITLDSSYVRYGKDDGDRHDVNLIGIFLPEVFKALKAKGVNLSKYYDSRTDNSVPLMAILYAGTGQAQSGQADDIWPCEFDLGSQYQEWCSGYRVNSVFFGNEMRSGSMNGIGVFCHEFGHAMGLPDIYATNYGHSTPLTGSWSIMESGCYVDGGNRPIDYTAHEKNQLGWLRLTEPTEPHVYTLYPMSSDKEPHALLLRNPENNAEYYILENRQPGRWSPDYFGAGLLVTHIDYNATNWAQNNVNNDGTHPRTVVVPADGSLSSDETDLYPTSSNRVLHDKSNPRTKVYTGTGLKHPVYNIKANKDGTVTLSYGSSSAPQYFTGDTVYIAGSKLNCIVSGYRELTVIGIDGGYSGDIVIPDDSVYFDHGRYKYVGIAASAFSGCESLTSVNVGNRVRTIEAGAFHNSPSLAAITVSEGNAYYESIGGALYTRLPDSAALVPVTATADFATNAQGLPVAQSLRNYEDAVLPATYTENGLTIGFTDGEAPAFLWNASGNVRLRIAKNAIMTITAPAGYTITDIAFTANTLSLSPTAGAMSSRAWTGEATKSVTFVCVSASTISDITATLQRDADDRHLVATPQNAADTFNVVDGITFIDAYAMCGAAYTSVTLPSSLTGIGADALSLTALTGINAYAETPAACTADPFTGIPETCVLHIPQGTLTAYKEAPYWQRFFPRMEEDLPTAIILRTTHSATDGILYDLQGRRVSNPASGVYIIDGRKIVH